MNFNDALHCWASNFIDDLEYQRLFLPLIERRILPNDLVKFYLYLEKAPKPSDELLLPVKTSNQSPFEFFLQIAYSRKMPIKIFSRFINYIPKNRVSFFINRFASNLAVSDLIYVITSFPDVHSKYIFFCKLLIEEKTFMSAFIYLFENFNKLSKDVKNILNGYLRKSFSLGICRDSLSNMVHCIFENAPITNNGFSEPLNLFFSALTDDASILMQYCSLKNIDNLFDQCRVRNDLPPSFLRFLIFTSANYDFTNEQFWAFAVSAPSPMFTYINHLDDLHNESMWIQILSTTISLESIELQNNVFLAFLFCVLQRPDLISIFIQLRLHERIPHILKQHVKQIPYNHSYLAMLILFLSFTRINENTACALTKFKSTELNIGTLFEIMLQDFNHPNNNHTTNTKTSNNSSSFSSDEDLTLNNLIDSLLWLFLPCPSFPIEGLIKIENEQVLSLFPYPSFTFITEIAPKILRPLILLNKESIISKILDTCQEKNRILFKEIASADLLQIFVEKSQSNPLYYKLLTTALSISCDFPIFSQVFQLICPDHEKTIDFLTILAENTPLVDDFLHINKNFYVETNVLNGTICMWIRNHSSNGIILNINTASTKIEIWHEFDDFYLSVNDKVVNRILNTASIENWRFLSLSLTNKTATFSINLESFSFPVNFNCKTSMTIGSSFGIFDLQSLKIQRPLLNQNQINQLFALGPNYKEFIISDFISFKDQQPFFASYLTFTSKLYINWADEFNKDNSSKASLSNTEISISPPYETKSSSRKSSSNLLLIDDTLKLFHQRITSTTFINSFDAQGGLSFLIYIWAEVILKHQQLIPKMFNLIDILLNRFPLVHHYFLRNSIYCLIGQLMRQVSYDALHLAINLKTRRITNSNIIRYWVLGPVLDKFEFSDSIKTLIDFANIKQNQQILKKSKAFVIIIQHISQNSEHSPEFLRLLCNLALTMTSTDNYIENATFLFDTLMIQHLRFSKQCNESVMPAINLVKLLKSMLETFPGLNKKLNLDLMMPAVVNASNYQEDLIDLLINFLDENSYYIFSIFLISLPLSHSVAERLYNNAVKKINSIVNIPSGVIPLHFVTFPLVYLSKHHEVSEYLYSLCAATSLLLEHYTSFPLYLYDQILQMIYSIESSNLMDDHTSRALDIHQVSAFSITTTPFTPFLTTFLAHAMLLKEFSQVKKFFISIFAIPMIAVYRKAAISLFLFGKMFEKLSTQINYPLKELESFLKFSLSYGSFVFKKIQMIPGDKTDSLSSIICYYLNKLLIYVDMCDSADLMNSAVDTLVDFSSLNSISAMIVDDIKKLPKFSKHRKFEKTIDRLQNPTSYTPMKIQTQKFEKTLEILTQKFNEQDKTNKTGMLTVWCNAVHYQTTSAGEIVVVDENGEKIIETWHRIFDTLLFPSSRIYENCPKKYKISDSTTRFERRRILMPINPSSDPLYTSFYDIKYDSELPKIRLTLKEVLENTSLTLWHSNNVKFSGDAVRLTGISLCRGILVVLTNQLKFYQKGYEDVLTFNFDNIRNIRQIDYMHQPRGILVENRNDNVYLFAFEAQSIRDVFVEVCESIKKFIVQKDIDVKDIDTLQTQWCEGLISNFDYLLKLNFISGRTWADFTQFPMFPWTLLDFSSKKINLSDPNVYRKLDYPLFAQSAAQQDACKRYYDSTSEITNNAHHYPNYISNVGSTLYFLVRLEPFTDAEFDFQGGRLDAADRTFQSFKISLDLMTTPGSKSALELVPECYFIPEMLENKNGLVFNSSAINQRDISDVTLPPWCRSPIEFVEIMRDALESDIVSSSLNEWIDLIWGFRRQGKPGFEKFNILQDIVFDFNPEEYMHDYLLMKAMSDQIHNCGQAPLQLFTNPHPKRKVFCSMKELSLHYLCEKSPEDDMRKPSNNQFVFINNDSICLARNSMTLFSFRFASEIKPKTIDVYGSKFVTGHRLPLINHWTMTSKGLKYLATLRGRLTEIKCVLIDPTMAIILAGHCDGYISIFSTNPHQFIREIHGNSDAPIEMLRVIPSKSSILTFQKENSEMTVITLWTINGAMLAVMKIPDNVIDCKVSNFPEGTRRNIIVLLTDKDELIILRSESLEEKGRITLESKNHTSLHFYKPHDKCLLFVTKKDKSHSVFAVNANDDQIM
ncbi:Beige/BEACH domain containing protein [Tritrichomonas foetus]|uniref:Beige/BEACH domain containing protein n=1 Tax=Tritrichomonas foetus TaxID=1144522 RepID=A0A1J4J8H2_9EUKA|nr:Beige/BEACH domain containing protein [Tritrichomonas foetus]|eukprot:OHS94993.1 Beige/BEACH domain containing protein [Tritrichomonas foetus]